MTDITVPEELPVFPYGCDSSYSWSKRFKKLQRRGTPEEVASELYKLMYNNKTHVAFTGGEPLMKAGQKNIVKVLTELSELYTVDNHRGYIENVTFETNGTRFLEDVLIDEILSRENTTEFFFSVSPKIWSTSGEKDRICPDVVQGYYELSSIGQLKFVCNGTEQSWDEIEDAIASFRHSGVMYPIWIMPVGATEESQNEIAAEIAEQTMNRGYNVSARVHCYIWGNEIGR